MTRQKKAVCVKQEYGSIRQKKPGGPYYFRYQVNGQRQEVSLHTTDREEAERKAKELVPVAKSSNIEIVAAHVKVARGIEKRKMDLLLSEIWTKYSVHPDRATPLIHEQLAYQATFQEFVDYVTNTDGKNNRHTVISAISELTPVVAEEYSEYLKTTGISVHTHNRKIKRIRKIFKTLHEYYSGENPFASKALMRTSREEQGKILRRQSFTREQEQKLCEVLSDTVHKVMNKPEIRVIYYLGMFTGQRLKDCVLMQWQNIDLTQRKIWVKQFKTGKEVTIPIAPELYAILKDAEAWKRDLFVCPNSAARYSKTNSEGKNVGNNLIDLDVLRVIRWIGVEPSVAVEGRKKKCTVLGFHSLRHAFCSFCAESGVPKAVLLSILGTDSEIADRYYTHVGEAAQQQAIAAISSTMSIMTPQAKIERALEFLNADPPATPESFARLKDILSN